MRSAGFLCCALASILDVKSNVSFRLVKVAHRNKCGIAVSVYLCTIRTYTKELRNGSNQSRRQCKVLCERDHKV